MTPLRKAREALGLSQSQLAEASGIDKATISRAENGMAVSRENAERLAKFFNGDLSELEVLYPARYMAEELEKAG